MPRQQKSPKCKFGASRESLQAEIREPPPQVQDLNHGNYPDLPRWLEME
jgi:hypothetical protein